MIDPPPERATWYYGEWQSAYENLDVPNMRLEEGLLTSFDTDGKRGLVVLDDLMAETDGRVTNLFTKKIHHSDTSVIYLVQNIFPKNKESRTNSLNSQYLVVFKNPREASQLANICTLVEARSSRKHSPMRQPRIRPISTSDRPGSEHPRRQAPAHVSTAGRCTPEGLRTEGVCVVPKWVNRLLTGSGNQLCADYPSGCKTCLAE